MRDPLSHPVFSAGRDHAVGAWRDVLISYFPARVSVGAVDAVHRANQKLRVLNGGRSTITLGIIAPGIPMPSREVRAYAAKVNRESTAFMKGECFVISGHPFWVGMARSALRAIELVARPWHPRAVFESLLPATEWIIERAGHDTGEAAELLETARIITSAFGVPAKKRISIAP